MYRDVCDSTVCNGQIKCDVWTAYINKMCAYFFKNIYKIILYILYDELYMYVKTEESEACGLEKPQE